ncbi:MAG: tripartite tricarboxylate transporter family receptor [Hyphomicrobiales bacterium]|nr:tripartite tricarboxylate transporter family receptor [Hyphomicrobiales bacterium]
MKRPMGKTRQIMRRAGLAALGATAVMVAAAAGATAAQNDRFTEDKVVTIYVSLPPGGSYDSYARLLSRFIGKYLAGQPSSVIVKNMPGGGGITLANYLFNIAPKDGTHFGTFESGVPFAPILKDVPAKYDPQQFGWLGSLAKVVPMVIARKGAAVTSTDDLFTKELKVGASGAGSDTMGFPLILNQVLGTKLKVIQGYPGAPDISLAIERGELDGYAAWCWDCMKAQKPEWVKTDFVRVLMQIAIDGDNELNARGVPTALELARTPEQRAQLQVALASGLVARPFTAPPNIDAERLRSLREAFVKAAADPELLAEAERLQLPISVVDGEKLSALVNDIYKTDPALLAQVKAAWSGTPGK